MTDSYQPIIDREFAEKFLRAADDPFAYPVYLLFHEFWAGAPQSAIDGYLETLHGLPGAEAFLAERHLPEPLTMDDLAACAPGTLGHAFRRFVVDGDLTESLARDYKAFNEQLTSQGALDRLPEDLSYTIVRGFQMHDMLHVITGHDASPLGELGMAAFHFAQLRFPYHAIRMAVTMAHLAFVQPGHTESAMDAISRGWLMGRSIDNIHFVKWEQELHTPLDDIRARVGVTPMLAQAA
ncbi:MAG: Coq4 family protein [Pseudomonadota bacterium]